MFTPTDTNVLSQSPGTTINGEEWYKAVISLDFFVRALRPLLGCEHTITYIDKWNEIFSSMADLKQDFPGTVYKDESVFQFGDTPNTFLQFCHELLVLVPLREVFTFRRTIPRTTMVMSVNIMDDDIKAQIMTIHLGLQSNMTTTENDNQETDTRASNAMGNSSMHSKDDTRVLHGTNDTAVSCKLVWCNRY